ncbi:hypothetical protein PIIN_09440 [Serendipita indica DSM 11827]|uniref:F-box domain-containing protein n=1 Tax=Serendipita indica (strain DSM 11827) TaxID=1109443 RepID=G4TVW4_SERID|nr:hypothetical protein PIIN_09440 [Serendipita indica DSM 11827]
MAKKKKSKISGSSTQEPPSITIPECYRWNLLPTARSQARLNQLTAAKGESLKMVEVEITATKKAIDESEAEIANLEKAISRTEYAADLMEKCLKSFKTAMSDASSLDGIPTEMIASAIGLKGFDLCETAALLTGSSSSTELKALSSMMSRWSSNVEKMKETRLEMKKELLGWRLERALHSDYLVQLEGHHDSLKEIINAIHATMSPIRKTPTEIWIKIFNYWIQDRDLIASHHNLPSPLLLGHVCSLWRQICLSTPHLWRRVDIHPFLLWPRPLLDITAGAKKATGSQSLEYVFFHQFRAYWGVQTEANPYQSWFDAPSGQLKRQDLTSSQEQLTNLPHLRLYLSPSAPLTVPTLSVNSTKKTYPLWEFRTTRPRLGRAADSVRVCGGVGYGECLAHKYFLRLNAEFEMSPFANQPIRII